MTTTRTVISADEATGLLTATGRQQLTDQRGGSITAAHVRRMIRMRRTITTKIEDGDRVRLYINCRLGYPATIVDLTPRS
jgi:hypothetical protein